MRRNEGLLRWGAVTLTPFDKLRANGTYSPVRGEPVEPHAGAPGAVDAGRAGGHNVGVRAPWPGESESGVVYLESAFDHSNRLSSAELLL